MEWSKILSILFLSLAVHQFVAALDNGVARTPPMGWNTWNHMGCTVDCTAQPDLCVNEKNIMEIAKAVADKLAPYGYEYVNIDDCWLSSTRDNEGNLLPDPVRFPSGIRALSDYIHNLGLKFGIYEDCGAKTCGGYPGSLGHEQQDAFTYAKWGVDYLKLDGCFLNASMYQEKYTLTYKVLNETGRKIVYSCSWPAYALRSIHPKDFDWRYISTICNLWRYTDDIRDTSASWREIVDYTVHYQTYISPNARPGQWNDPDMLEVGNGGQSTSQYKSHFSFWAILAAPLIAGNDPRSMDQSTLDILTNTDVIKVNQDVLGIQEIGQVVRETVSTQVWVKPLYDGSFGVLLYNKFSFPWPVVLQWADLGLSTGTPANVYDLWEHVSKGNHTDTYEAEVEGKGVVMVKVSRIN